MVAATLTIAIGIGAAIKFGDVPTNLLSLLEVIFGAFSMANVVNTLGAARTVKVEESMKVEEIVKVEEPITAPVGIPVQDAIEAFGILRQDVTNGLQIIRQEAAINQAELKQALDGIMKSVDLSQRVLTALADRIVK